MPGDISRCSVCGEPAMYVIAFGMGDVQVAPTTYCPTHTSAFWRQVQPLRNERIVYFDQRIRADHAGLNTPFTGEVHVG